MDFSSLLILFSLFPTILAHNWVNSPSRSPQANTVSPFLPSATGSPHVQVRAGQPFQIEWVQGHGGSVWFIFMSEKDADKAKLHTPTMMDAYLNEASATKTVPSGKWSRWHRSAKNDKVHGKTANYFVNHVPNNNANYILRDENFKGTFSGQPSGGIKPADVFQMIYPAACLNDDRLTFHKSTTYPWVIGMRRAKICVHEPSRPDVALFQFPTGTPPGNYIIHYRWSGYYDAIDVEIVSGNKDVAKPYGVPVPPGAPEPPARYQKIDHCEFKKPSFRYPCKRMTTTELGCLSFCSRQPSVSCDGVNVVPVYNRATVAPQFINITNIVYDNDQCRQSEIKPVNEEPDYNRFVCYAVKGAPPSDIATPYTVTTDPADPAFYSTCWIRKPPVTLQTPSPPAKLPPALYQFGVDYCLSCTWALRNVQVNKTSLWPLKQHRCVNCDNPPIKYAAHPFGKRLDDPVARIWYNKTNFAIQKHQFDGVNRIWANPPTCPNVTIRGDSVFESCSVALRVLGSNNDVDVTQEDVESLIDTKYSDVCSKAYMQTTLNNALPGRPETKQYIFHCLKKKPACCLNVKLVPSNRWTIHRAPPPINK